ncbi:MAG: S9 family peptidase [Thermoanaerobaculaceae bacterium]|nr:S9 family peptidase [Thermoanaerobaculaceae bacterium]
MSKTCQLVATVVALSLALPGLARASDPPPREGEVAQQLAKLQAAQESLEHRLDELAKAIDDVAWFQRVGDVALVDKWRITGPPDPNPPNPSAPGATNPIKFYTYTFVPRQRPTGSKLPAIVLPHGGVHADFTTYHAHIVRELVEQGYVVIAPDYRGSTGYGEGFYRLIDYGGCEVEDVHAAKEWALATFDFLDRKRIGLVGWSHGGLIVLMEAFAHPKEYACVFAGVPVSDLVMRMGYADQDYLDLYSADYHIGKTVREDIEEYKRRSPVWSVEKLEVPLRIHTTTNDEDVNFIEVEHLIQALKAAGKQFEYEVFKDAPGGHSFDRLDIPTARAARAKIWTFLARYLSPPHPPQ